MKFSLTRPVKIVMLGAGGTGGHIAPHLYRLLYSLDRPVRFIICDGDVVEEKNLVRQNFTPADLGENKAQVLAERYSTVFGMETEYVPTFVESEEQLRGLLTPAGSWQSQPGHRGSVYVTELVILISAVDNNKSRQLCHRVFQQAKELIYIDSGNGEYTGQVVCGVRRGGRTYYPPIGTAYEEPTGLAFGNPTVITGGSGRGKTSIADAIAFVITGLPFFGERGIDKLHNEVQPDVSITLRFVDETGCAHALTRTRHKNNMAILYDGYAIRQMDLTDMFGERDVFLSIFNPLYFIEELGNDGKNLLERHLPMISHETVLAQLSDTTRAALEGENILSPETFLKKKREEIRELEETIIYLRGQQDQAQSQGETLEQRVSNLKAQYEALTTELEGLEAKRFDGLDRKAMEQQLVDLSARYDEAARDGFPLDAEVMETERRLAARRAEQYQPKYTQAIADANARMEQLGKQFNTDKKAFQFFKPGVACPTCRRAITEEALEEVRAALEKPSKEVLAAGHEQRGQLAELQDLETKAKAVFENFRAQDVAALEEKLAQLKEQKDNDSPADDLRAQIQQLNADLEYGNLSEVEYARLKECREELRECAADLKAAQAVANQEQTDFDAKIRAAQDKISALKKLMSSVAIYVSKRAELTFSALKMNKVEISLYDVVKTTGERKDAFKFTYGGRRYDRLSLSEKIRAGMEVSELMKRLTGRNYPVFVDNMESVDDLANVRPTGQVIMAKCVRGTPLSVRPVKPIPVVERQAA